MGSSPFGNEAYPPLPDSRTVHIGIRSLIRVGTLVWALGFSVLYPRCLTYKAIPQYISKRTSYHGI